MFGSTKRLKKRIKYKNDLEREIARLVEILGRMQNSYFAEAKKLNKVQALLKQLAKGE